jgi:iron(III) transport system ATP-binding protein
MTSLRLHDISKRFGTTIAADRVAFDLGDHELLALVGPSGCGKSTVLRMIAGLYPIDEGCVELSREVVDDGRSALPPERRGVGLVFQEHALFPHLSVDGNVGFGVRSGDRAQRVAEMLELVGLGEHGGRYPHELSGGERQRVALARALAPRPRLLLLDEPFASLDPNLRTRIRDDVAEILRRTRTPAVFVTHDQNEALAIGDRIAVMRDGRIRQLGSPEDVFHRPVDRFVASFMGEAAFVPLAEAIDQIAGVEPSVAAPGATAGVLMLRPDDVTFHVDDRGRATVVAAEFRGSTWCYRLRLPSGVDVLSVRSHLDRVPTGSSVVPAVRPGHLPVLLDAEPAP